MKTRIVLPAALVAGLFVLASTPSAHAFMLGRVLGGAAQHGAVQNGGCGACQKGGATQKGGCGAA